MGHESHGISLALRSTLLSEVSERRKRFTAFLVPHGFCLSKEWFVVNAKIYSAKIVLRIATRVEVQFVTSVEKSAKLEERPCISVVIVNKS